MVRSHIDVHGHQPNLLLMSPMAQMTSAWFFTNDPNHHVSYISAFLPWWFGTWPVGGAKGTSSAICANEASQGAKEVTSKSLEAIYETWGFLKANFPQWKFPLLEFFPLGYIPLSRKKVMGNTWKWNPSNFWLLKLFLKKTDLEMDWACNLSLF